MNCFLFVFFQNSLYELCVWIWTADSCSSKHHVLNSCRFVCIVASYLCDTLHQNSLMVPLLKNGLFRWLGGAISTSLYRTCWLALRRYIFLNIRVQTTVIWFIVCVSTLYRKWSWCPRHQVIDSAGKTTCELFPCSKDLLFLLNPDALKQTHMLPIALSIGIFYFTQDNLVIVELSILS